MKVLKKEGNSARCRYSIAGKLLSYSDENDSLNKGNFIWKRSPSMNVHSFRILKRMEGGRKMNRFMSWLRRGNINLMRNMSMRRMMGRRGTMLSLTSLAVGATAYGWMRRRQMQDGNRNMYRKNIVQRAIQPIRTRMGR